MSKVNVKPLADRVLIEPQGDLILNNGSTQIRDASDAISMYFENLHLLAQKTLLLNYNYQNYQNQSHKAGYSML